MNHPQSKPESSTKISPVPQASREKKAPRPSPRRFLKKVARKLIGREEPQAKKGDPNIYPLY